MRSARGQRRRWWKRASGNEFVGLVGAFVGHMWWLIAWIPFRNLLYSTGKQRHYIASNAEDVKL